MAIYFLQYIGWKHIAIRLLLFTIAIHFKNQTKHNDSEMQLLNAIVYNIGMSFIASSTLFITYNPPLSDSQCLTWAGAHLSWGPAPTFFYCWSSCSSYRILAQKYWGTTASTCKQNQHPKWVLTPISVKLSTAPYTTFD